MVVARFIKEKAGRWPFIIVLMLYNETYYVGKKQTK